MSLEKIQKVKNHLQVYATTCKKTSNYKKKKKKKNNEKKKKKKKKETTNKISFFLQVYGIKVMYVK